jgi:hypothetical protein
VWVFVLVVAEDFARVARTCATALLAPAQVDSMAALSAPKKCRRFMSVGYGGEWRPKEIFHDD